MKRIYPAVFFILICVSLCIFSSISTEKHAERLIVSLGIIEEQAVKESYDRALSEYSVLKDQWKNSKTLFNSFSQTKLTDEINSIINVLGKYIEAKEKTRLITEINRCINQLQEVYNWQKVNIDNIL